MRSVHFKSMIVAAALAGCAHDSTVTVGPPGQKGVIRSSIDRSRDVAKEASDRIQQGNKDAVGG